MCDQTYKQKLIPTYSINPKIHHGSVYYARTEPVRIFLSTSEVLLLSSIYSSPSDSFPSPFSSLLPISISRVSESWPLHHHPHCHRHRLPRRDHQQGLPIWTRILQLTAPLTSTSLTCATWPCPAPISNGSHTLTPFGNASSGSSTIPIIQSQLFRFCLYIYIIESKIFVGINGISNFLLTLLHLLELGRCTWPGTPRCNSSIFLIPSVLTCI